MKVAFVQTLPFMMDSYMVISASLKQNGIETEVFISAFEKDLHKSVAESGADLVGFNTLSGSYAWALDAAKKIKGIKNIPVVFGGCHPTYYPETVDFSIVDYICVGEGEYATVDLVKALCNGTSTENIANMGFKKNGKLVCNPLRPLIKTLGELPFSDRALYSKYEFSQELSMYYYRTSRCCPYKCTFCAMENLAQQYKGQQVFREYPVDYVIEELVNIKNDYPNLQSIMFSDEIFGLNKKRTFEILQQFKEKIGIPYTITTRANLIDDDFIKLLTSTNCELLSISVETANEDIRSNILKKRISNDILITAGNKLYDAGIKTRVNCIFCLPDETLEDAFDNIKLMKDMKVTDPVGFLLQPFPKTGVYDYAIEKGYINVDQMQLNDLDPLVFFRTPMAIPNKRKIVIVQKLFKLACNVPYFDKILRVLVYFPDNFIFSILHKIGIALSHKNFYNYTYWELIKYLWAAKNLDTKTSI